MASKKKKTRAKRAAPVLPIDLPHCPLDQAREIESQVEKEVARAPRVSLSKAQTLTAADVFRRTKKTR